MQVMKNYFAIILSILLLIAVNNVSVDACWCRKDPEETNTDENFRKTVARLVNYSDVVFAGTLVEENNDQLIFKVENVWKGDFKDSITFYFPHDVIDSCQFNFEIGKNYLVYADVTLNGLSVSKCGRTNFLINAQRDIDELNRQKPQAVNLNLELFHAEMTNSFF